MYSQLTSTLSSCNRVTTGLIMLLCVFLSLIYSDAWLYVRDATTVSYRTTSGGKKRNADNCTNLFVILFLLRMHRH